MQTRVQRTPQGLLVAAGGRVGGGQVVVPPPPPSQPAHHVHHQGGRGLSRGSACTLAAARHLRTSTQGGLAASPAAPMDWLPPHPRSDPRPPRTSSSHCVPHSSRRLDTGSSPPLTPWPACAPAPCVQKGESCHLILCAKHCQELFRKHCSI